MRLRLSLFFVVLVMLSVTFVPALAQEEDRLQIVASHSILADVISNVIGDAADVTSVMPVGADPHSFQPTPSDIITLADADVVFVNGALFEEGLMEAIENADTEMNIVTASSCVEMIAFGGHEHEEGEEHAHEEGEEHEEGEDHAHDEEHAEGEEHGHEEGEEHADEMGEMSAIATLCEAHYAEMDAIHEAHHEHEEGEEHGHEEGEEEHAEDEEHAHDEEHDHEHGEFETLGALYAVDCGEGHGHEEGEEEHAEDEHGEEHAHGACDPHVWMEPHNVMYWTMRIRDTLVEMDPTNAETYTANAESYLLIIDELAHDFVRPMVDSVPEENRVLVTNHESLGYFAARYDFEVADTIIPGGDTMSDPSAAEIANIIDTVREQAIPAIFAETTVNDSLVQQIAEETGVGIYVLYSGSLSDAAGPASSYVDYIRYNVTTIVEALGGGMEEEA
jgi:ABC-type Zn uptake system ZnuABC Zn-binding protein ZnuA